MEQLLRVKNLCISFPEDDGENRVAKSLSFSLHKDEILGIVGESGSGKSVTALGLMGLLPTQANISGSVHLKKQLISAVAEKELLKVRGNKISMIFQEPMSSLNPSLTCGFQVLEVLLEHTDLTKKAAIEEVKTLFHKVKLPRVDELFKQYPHQLSGGQKQRVMIAMAIACKPSILIADEPTTALDVTVQKEIIELLKSLQEETGMSIIFISHDLALVAEIADRVLVMYQGKIVEEGVVEKVFKSPNHNYTKALINSKPTLGQRLQKLPTVQDFLEMNQPKEYITDEERRKTHAELYSVKPILEVQNLATYFQLSGGHLFSQKKVVKAVDEVSLKIFEGETLGLVGESGCGKTTLGRTILQLENITKGQVFYKGKDVTVLNRKKLKELRREIQIIFQDPFSSLNPRIPVGQAILEPMKVHHVFNTHKERKHFVLELLEKVGLEKGHFHRYPHEFSGGQRQRIGVARTIALRPKLIICDESVSALDVSVQAQVLNLLKDLKSEFGFTYLFISHDLSVVKYMADKLIVMQEGKIVEYGEADAIYSNPTSPYTKKLIDAIPKGI